MWKLKTGFSSSSLNYWWTISNLLASVSTLLCNSTKLASRVYELLQLARKFLVETEWFPVLYVTSETKANASQDLSNQCYSTQNELQVGAINFNEMYCITVWYNYVLKILPVAKLLDKHTVLYRIYWTSLSCLTLHMTGVFIAQAILEQVTHMRVPSQCWSGKVSICSNVLYCTTRYNMKSQQQIDK